MTTNTNPTPPINNTPEVPPELPDTAKQNKGSSLIFTLRVICILLSWKIGSSAFDGTRPHVGLVLSAVIGISIVIAIHYVFYKIINYFLKK